MSADERSILDIVPASYLPGVTGSVHMTCRPPATDDIAQVLTLQVNKQRDDAAGHDSVATYVTSDSPLVANPLGALLNAHVSGSYDNAHPHSAFLRLVVWLIFRPKVASKCSGKQMCAPSSCHKFSHALFSLNTLQYLSD